MAEQARIDMWLTDYNNKQKQNHMPEEHDFLDTGEYSLLDLLEDEEIEKEEEKNEEWELVKGLFSSKRVEKRAKLPEVLELKLPQLSKI